MPHPAGNDLKGKHTQFYFVKIIPATPAKGNPKTRRRTAYLALCVVYTPGTAKKLVYILPEGAENPYSSSALSGSS